MSVPVSQLLLEKDLERFGELLGDVRKGDVLHPAGFDELPEVGLGGLRLAVGGSGVDLLGACLLYTSKTIDRLKSQNR